MKNLILVFILALTALSSANAIAQADIKFSTNISPMVVNDDVIGTFGGFFGPDSYDLKHSGLNQVVFQYWVNYREGGILQKYNSPSFVVTFDVKDGEFYTLEPYRQLKNIDKRKSFVANPTIHLLDSSGNKVDAKIEYIGVPSHVGQDLLRELKRYNRVNNIQVRSDSLIAEKDSIVESVVKELSQAGQLPQTSPASSKALDMAQYWFEKASASEKEQIVEWAFANRKVVNVTELSGSKPLEMMSYWFKEASPEERKAIAGWLAAQ